jgi:hypothetical protein
MLVGQEYPSNARRAEMSVAPKVQGKQCPSGSHVRSTKRCKENNTRRAGMSGCSLRVFTYHAYGVTDKNRI